MPTTNGATYVSDSTESPDAAWSASAEDPPARTNRRWQSLRPRGGEEPGLPGWAAVAVLVAISAVGGVIDEINGASVRGWFNWSLVIASLISIVLVRRSQMFGVVIAPPLIYFVASAGMLYFRSSGLKDRTVLINAAANWLVYGFPAIAGATAVVLLIAGIRMIVRR